MMYVRNISENRRVFSEVEDVVYFNDFQINDGLTKFQDKTLELCICEEPTLFVELNNGTLNIKTSNEFKTQTVTDGFYNYLSLKTDYCKLLFKDKI